MNKHEWIKFEKGNLKDLTIFSTEEYVKNYSDGNTDIEMIDDISTIPLDDKVIFDVGAFIGLSSLLFSKLSGIKGKVIAFEPNEFNRDRIAKNFEKNQEFANKIKIYPYALSNENNQTKIIISSNIEGPSSTSRLYNAHAKIASENLPPGFMDATVETKKLDDFVSQTKIIPDIIKVDIEGAEHLMLLGSLDTLKKYHPILYIEIHSEFCAIKCYEILKSCNYDIEIIHEELDNRIMIKAVYSNKEKHDDDKKYFESKLAFESVNKKIKKINEKIDVIEESLKTFIFVEETMKKVENSLKKLEENSLEILKDKDNELNITKNQLEETMKKVENSLKKLEENSLEILKDKDNELNITKNQLEETKRELSSIYLSKSWNFIKPFRVMKNKLKRSGKI